LAEASPGRLTSGLHWAWNQITSQLWFRVSLYAIGAVLTTLVAKFVAPVVPEWITESIGDNATWDILSILASSMLVVATFSLGTMVQAFAAASSSATPRAARILIDDPFTQNVLATFLGAFVFAMVGLVALGFGYYSAQGRTVLLAAAGLVILLVISSFFAWLDHLANMVRLGETQRKIEARARTVLEARAEAPLLGGVAMTEADRAGTPLMGTDTLYVQHVDLTALQSVAEGAGGRVAVGCLAGAVTDPTSPLVWTSWPPDEDARDALREAFTLGPERSFDQDPRFCLQVLAEIGSRALSPGINDPGTAIGILVGQQRLLTSWGRIHHDPVTGDDEPRFPRVAVAPLRVHDLFDDAFGPFLRDGAGIIEVGLRLQKALVTLAALGLPHFAEEARRLSLGAIAQANEALVTADDRDRLAAAAAPLATGTAGSPT
jgi:uncharacterized membrane protein